MSDQDFRQEYETRRRLIDQQLDTLFTEPCQQQTLLEAMRYSLLAGGKRIRPVLCLAFCTLAGGRDEEAVPFACGIELLHTYSLIHDDLPCMDDDDLRRGVPTCHKKFGETTAVLAGDALQAAAFRLVLSADCDGQAKSDAALRLAQAAGEMGMCGGQYLDTEQGHDTAEALYEVHRLKTGALLRASCAMGVLASRGHRTVDPGALDAAEEYAEHLGIAFQIRDDLLDETASTETLGKPAGSDRAGGKTTFATLLGADECRRLIVTHTEKAKEVLSLKYPDAGFLLWMADYLAGREN